MHLMGCPPKNSLTVCIAFDPSLTHSLDKCPVSPYSLDQVSLCLHKPEECADMSLGQN
jgi:hypothetical protein